MEKEFRPLTDPDRRPCEIGPLEATLTADGRETRTGARHPRRARTGTGRDAASPGGAGSS